MTKDSEEFENTRMVYVNSYYRAGHPLVSKRKAIYSKMEICLLPNQQCTYYQNWTHKIEDTLSGNKTINSKLYHGTWTIENPGENGYSLILFFREGFNLNFELTLTPRGEVFLNGKRFQISKIKS